MKNSCFHGIKIAGIELSSNLFLAPMAGYTDRAFTQVCYEMGAGLAFTEMVSAEAVCRGSEKTLNLAKSAPNAVNHAIQLFGGEADRCALAAVKLLSLNPAIIDFNCGCPVPKVIKTGAGSALMQHPSKVQRIVAQTRKALDDAGANHVAITVKFRSGWDANSINFMEVAEAAWKGGVDMVSMHPRTRSQGYSGSANWEHLAVLAKESPVPVCGSGDLYSIDDAISMFETTGCHCVMFARGAVGHPWIFRQGKEFSTNSINPNQKEILDIAWNHLLLACDVHGEEVGVREMRKHLCAYTKGISEGKAFRNRLLHCLSIKELRECFDSFSIPIDF